jgi:uncharacterized protein
MPSALLEALYHRRHDEAQALAAARPELDVFEAAALGDGPRLQRILDRDGAAARAWSDDGFTALHLAAFFGRPVCVTILLDAGADANAVARNAMAVQPLHSAVASGSLQCTNLLLAAGANPNARQAGGYTPIHEAVQAGNVTLETALLAMGADASVRADDGRGVAEFRKTVT